MSRVQMHPDEAIDQLDGEELRGGERVRVTWPDGSRTEEMVVTERRRDSFEEGGRVASRLVSSKAFIEIGHRGAWVKVRLLEAGVDVERIR